MTIDEYMGHQPRGGRRKFLKRWTEKDPYSITVWIHPRSSILSIWRHPFNRVEAVEDKNTKAKSMQVWSLKLLCYEDEATLGNRFRDKVTRERDAPFQLCPQCLMIEDVARMVRNRQLNWLQPLFYFQGSDPTKNRVIHAGGIFNAFSNKDLTPEQKKEMADLPAANGGPLYQNKAWMQNGLSKQEYVFSVIDHEHPQDGIQLDIEPGLLGEKVQALIKKRIEDLGQEDGHIRRKPYAIRFEFNPQDGIQFDKKYDATPLSRVAMTPMVAQLMNTDPPDPAGAFERFNLQTHRALLERFALVQLPWDRYFEKALAWEKEQKAREAAAKPVPQQSVPEVGRTVAPQVPAWNSQSMPLQPGPTTTQAEMFGCDQCGQAMVATDVVCAHCGARYDVQPAAPAAPTLPPKSQATAMPAAQPMVMQSHVADPPVQQQGYPGDPNDDVPF